MINVKNYDKKKHIKKRLHSIFEISDIRFQKILEMTQEGFVSFFFALIVAIIFNKYSFSLNTTDNIEVIILKSLFEVLLLIIIFYYLRKVIMLIPFIFHYTESYIPSRPSRDGEGLMGKTIAIAIIFGSVLKKLKDKIAYFSNYITNT